MERSDKSGVRSTATIIAMSEQSEPLRANTRSVSAAKRRNNNNERSDVGTGAKRRVRKYEELGAKQDL
jgi:hypothetical protein